MQPTERREVPGSLSLPAHKNRPQLDRIRWISAVAVAFGHALGMTISSSRGNTFLKAIAEIRSPAVTVFFLLSGYLVGGPILLNYRTFDWRRYSIARFSRIYVVLVPAILLTVCLDFAAFHLWPSSAVYTKPWQGGALGATAINTRYSLESAVSAILCLQPLLGGSLGSAGSLWSLGYEWTAYAFFPVLFVPFAKKRGRLEAALFVLLVLGLVALAGSKARAVLWGIWFAGAIAYWLNKKLDRDSLWGDVSWLLLAAASCVCHWLPTSINILLVTGFGVLALSFRGRWEARETSSLDRFVTNRSYSLYVIHLQVQTFALGAMVELGAVDVLGNIGFGRLFGSIALLLFVSFFFTELIYQAFEKRTPVVRARIERFVEARLGK